MTNSIEDKWSLGFLLLDDAKRVYSDYGDNFWVVILMDNNKDYYAYLLQDNLFHCKVIGEKMNYGGNIAELKNRINSRLDNHCGEIRRMREYYKKINNNFKNWDGCLTKEDSRDKKISDIC